ncbi:DUF6950 family protein [Brevundimonas aurantiaca]|uniref:DUF6950 family protein n=1 Tax=Brevundimonas aurantiaca TaxID=74316 RepID=UPI0030169847
MTTMLKRAAATQACMDRFAYKPVEPGVRDCGKLAAHALHKQGRSAKLLNASRHKTWRGALAYLKRTGFASLVDLIDAMGLERIAPAAALPGDLIALPSEEGDGFGCSLAVALDNGRVLALNRVSGLIEPMIPHMFVCAWRV